MRRDLSRKILPHISATRGSDGNFSALAGTASALCSSPRILSPLNSAFVQRGVRDDAGSRTVGSTHTLPVADGGPPRNHKCCHVAWARLSCRALQTERFHRAPSLPDCPCSPSVTRSVLFPRPAARRRSASASPPCGSWFLPEGRPPGMRGLALGSGAPHVASRRSVPRAIRGKSKQEKFQWHSIPTPSL